MTRPGRDRSARSSAPGSSFSESSSMSARQRSTNPVPALRRSSAATAGSSAASSCSGAPAPASRRNSGRDDSVTAAWASTVSSGSPAGAGTPSAASELRNVSAHSAVERLVARDPVARCQAGQTFPFLSWWAVTCAMATTTQAGHRQFSTVGGSDRERLPSAFAAASSISGSTSSVPAGSPDARCRRQPGSSRSSSVPIGGPLILTPFPWSADEA